MTASDRDLPATVLDADPTEEFPDEVEMSFWDHFEELRQRIFYSLIAVAVGWVLCFLWVKPLVRWLQQPAHDVNFIQQAPGEFFFISFKVAGYAGLLLAMPVILYNLIRFIFPGLSRREQTFVGPMVFGSSILFFAGLAFAYYVIAPAAFNFFLSYGQDVVAPLWSIERYFETLLSTMLFVGLVFQVPVLQILFSLVGILNSWRMLRIWREMVVGALVIGAVLTPSTDPLTQSLLAVTVLFLYFSGIGVVKFIFRR